MTISCIIARNDYLCGVMTNKEFVERLFGLYRKYAGRGLAGFVERIFTFDYRYDDDRKEAVDMEFKFITAMRDDIFDLIRIVKEDTIEHSALVEMKALFDERIITIMMFLRENPLF